MQRAGFAGGVEARQHATDSTSRSAIRGPTTSGSASSRSTGCRKKCRWARTCKDWAQPERFERNLLTQIFRFFTQADVEVNDNYMERYSRVFKPTEIKMMLAAFSNMETIHIAAYATCSRRSACPRASSPPSQYKEMKDKHDYMQQVRRRDDEDIARTLADVRRLHRRPAAVRQRSRC
jgi:hypothetical protein